MGQPSPEGTYYLCPECGWSGRGEDLVGKPAIECPVCGTRIRK